MKNHCVATCLFMVGLSIGMQFTQCYIHLGCYIHDDESTKVNVIGTLSNLGSFASLASGTVIRGTDIS